MSDIATKDYVDTVLRLEQAHKDALREADEYRRAIVNLEAEIEPLTKANMQLREGAEEQKQRIKRLEEAGDAIVGYNIGCGCGEDGPCRACRLASEAWTKAKEAKP